MEDERIRRPELDRDHPIRNWSTLFGGPDGGAPADGGAVSRAVELGYRVIDEYIRQGQKAASRMRSGQFDAQTMQSDMEELAMRMAQYASDFTSVWGELINRGMGDAEQPGAPEPGRAPQPTTQAAPPQRPRSAPSPAPTATPGRTQVRLQVASVRPAEVSIDLQPGAGDRPLTAHALRAADGDSGRITDVSFEAADDGSPPTLRVHISDDQPAGRYHGLLVDPVTNLPAGTVSVLVPEA